MEKREKGKGGGEGGGWGRDRQRNGKSMRKLCRNYPLADYPLVSPLWNLQFVREDICASFGISQERKI